MGQFNFSSYQIFVGRRVMADAVHLSSLINFVNIRLGLAAASTLHGLIKVFGFLLKAITVIGATGSIGVRYLSSVYHNSPPK